MASARPRSRRSPCRLRRWAALLLALALAVGLFGRGHVLQAIGWLPCEELSAAVAPSPEDAEGDGHGHDDCPPSCHRCPCGQIPMVSPAPTLPPIEGARDVTLLLAWLPPAAQGAAHAERVDRPPRRIRLS